MHHTCKSPCSTLGAGGCTERVVRQGQPTSPIRYAIPYYKKLNEERLLPLIEVAIIKCGGLVVKMDEENNLSGNERCSPDGDLAGRIKERLTHLELDNKYLEARVKLLENDGRNYRLKIDELRAELRERTETLVWVINSQAETSESSRSLLANNDKCALKRKFSDNESN
ncbi:hypothetical protein R1sor_000143 [Riccia sorocarpa]|uniref:Uncharacterized protein n=1 Tax=Riccia sorocarpa TaxID=122646 RepID=A0ABD3GWF4_9MARC